ncbi:MAG TPA: lytic transglycosylase domain-containing protein [Longimicrobiales bacterium]|nr:lytic transglycosylase domain-containing protein [Longimicrobiales bacterium]
MSEHDTDSPLNRPMASPPVAAGSGRVGDLLFQWETRHLSPWRRHLVRWWRSSRTRTGLVILGVALFSLGAAVTLDPDAREKAAGLEERLREAEDALRAREGELQLAHLELRRMQAIVERAQQHRIPPDLAAAIHDIAVSEGVDPALAFSLVRVESEFTDRAVSSAGAVGLTQVMPGTAFWLQPGLTHADLFERGTNLRLGFRYLRMLLEQYRGDLHLALLAYNRGPNRVDDILRAGGNPANGYSARVRTGLD